LHIISFYEIYHNNKWKKFRSDKKVDLNYAEKQGKKEVNNKDDNTYFFSEDKRYGNKKIIPKIELPKKYLDMYKKYNPTSVLLVLENTFMVKFK